ncbi:hypothetical protein HKD37_02G003795 [Glycine soja]
MKYMMNSVIIVLYFNGRVYEENNGVIFEDSKKAIQIKHVETMLESFQQQNQMSVLELYIEKDVTGGSMFHSANSLTSCKNNLSNNEVQPPTNVSNLHGDEDDDDDDYLVSNSYVEESLDEDDSVDDISDTDDEVADMIQPARIVHSAEGVQGIENPFWNDALHYNNINWSHPDEEDICGLEMPSSFNVGQELYGCMDFDTKDACPCPFYMRAILSKKTDSWKVTQWGGPHTCPNMTMTQDHEKLDSDLIATCVVGMIREDPSIKVSLIQERINSEFAYKQKAIALEYGDWEKSYAKLSSWLTHMQNHSPESYFQILHDDFIVGNTGTFKFCKPIIQVDDTHLYGKYRGTLLMATSQDENGGVLPLAFVVVEGETLTAWSWFLTHLRAHIIDKNEKFCQLSPAIATWIDRISKEKWTMAYDREGRRYGHMTTNLSKCINKVLKDCHNIPITALVKSTYSRCRFMISNLRRKTIRSLLPIC